MQQDREALTCSDE